MQAQAAKPPSAAGIVDELLGCLVVEFVLQFVDNSATRQLNNFFVLCAAPVEDPLFEADNGEDDGRYQRGM